MSCPEKWQLFLNVWWGMRELWNDECEECSWLHFIQKVRYFTLSNWVYLSEPKEIIFQKWRKPSEQQIYSFTLELSFCLKKLLDCVLFNSPNKEHLNNLTSLILVSESFCKRFRETDSCLQLYHTVAWAGGGVWLCGLGCYSCGQKVAGSNPRLSMMMSLLGLWTRPLTGSCSRDKSDRVLAIVCHFR